METANSTHLPVCAALFALAASTLILLLLKLFWWKPLSIARKLQQQGLKVLPYRILLGNVPDIKRLREQAALSCFHSASNHAIAPRVLPFYTKLFSESRGLPVVYWWGTQPRLLVTNPDDLKQILLTDFKRYKRSTITLKFLRRLLGVGLLTSDGQDWQNQRNILRHAFFADKLKAMVVDISAIALDLAKSWEKIVKESGQLAAEVEVAHDLKSATADIIARTSFGSSYEKGKAVFDKQVLLLQIMMQNIVSLAIPGYKFLPTPSNLQSWKLERSIDKELLEIVESRRNTVTHGGASSYGADLLGLILASEDEIEKQRVRLTTRQVMDECKTFFFAGHETTAQLLSWTMMLLGLYQDWQERARAEIVEVCGKEGEPSAENLSKMKILGMILNESLRLYPPVPELGPRVFATTHEESLKLGELSLPQGTSFAFPVLFLHRDKDLWGEDADEFRPERFSDGASKACKHPYGFLPFSAGPRNCIGQSFAIMEAKVVMATILQRFRFRLSPNYKHAPQAAITVRPQYGVQVILECA